jgi:hypothetical protein
MAMRSRIGGSGFLQTGSRGLLFGYAEILALEHSGGQLLADGRCSETAANGSFLGIL